MSSGINLPAVIIANLMGITILFTVLVSYNWNEGGVSLKIGPLKMLVFITFISCIADPLCFIADGKPGVFNRILVVGCNTWMYYCHMAEGVCWLRFICSRLDIELNRWQRLLLRCAFLFGAGLLVVNLFVPVVFFVDGNNVYSRTGMYWVYFVMQVSYLIIGFVLYVYARFRSGKLKFFPVWAFTLPVVVGAAIQSLFYGVSTIAPFVAVSIACITSCLQRELIYVDKLTGLYNRFYLSRLEESHRSGRTGERYTAVMLDINRFKQINDSHGHLTGDGALMELASILRRSVGVEGEVIRYAGDEFILILPGDENGPVKTVLESLQQELNTFNASGQHSYQLTVSTGSCSFSFREQSVNDLLGAIDRRMYENKQEFYRSHSQLDRRRR